MAPSITRSRVWLLGTLVSLVLTFHDQDDAMKTQKIRYSAEETSQRGDALYERDIRGQVETTHRGKIVAIDVDRGNTSLPTILLARECSTASAVVPSWEHASASSPA